MKQVLFGLAVVTSINVYAMNITRLLTSQEKTECERLSNECRLVEMQRYGSQLRTGIRNNENFKKNLCDVALSARCASDFMKSLRKRNVEVSPRVRQILSTSIASSLASLAELLNDKKIKNRVQKVCDEETKKQLTAVGLLSP